MNVIRGRLIKKTIATGEIVLAHLPLEIVDLCAIVARTFHRWQQFEPDRVEFQSSETEHPLQRHGKIPPALEILRRKSASEKNCHPTRIARVSSTSSILPVFNLDAFADNCPGKANLKT